MHAVWSLDQCKPISIPRGLLLAPHTPTAAVPLTNCCNLLCRCQARVQRVGLLINCHGNAPFRSASLISWPTLQLGQREISHSHDPNQNQQYSTNTRPRVRRHESRVDVCSTTAVPISTPATIPHPPHATSSQRIGSGQSSDSVAALAGRSFSDRISHYLLPLP